TMFYSISTLKKTCSSSIQGNTSNIFINVNIQWIFTTSFWQEATSMILINHLIDDSFLYDRLYIWFRVKLRLDRTTLHRKLSIYWQQICPVVIINFIK